MRISSAADVAWKRLCDETRNARDPIEAFERLEQGRGDEFKSMIDYDNRQLAEEVIPAYRRMLTVFRDNLWLAEPETRTYFEVLLEFVELWERWLAQSIPYEVVQALEHSEARLHPFYAHLAAKHDELRKRLCQI